MGSGSRLDFGKAFGQARTSVQLVLERHSKAIEKEIQYVIDKRASKFFKYIAREFFSFSGGSYKSFTHKGFGSVTWRALAKGTLRRKQSDRRGDKFFVDGSSRGQTLKRFFKTVDPTAIYADASVSKSLTKNQKVRFTYSLFNRTAEKRLMKGIEMRSPLQARKLQNPKGVKRQLLEPALKNYMAMRVNAQIIRRLKERKLIK